MPTNQLSKEEMDAIDNYGSRIKQLKTFQEGVQARPGMYIGSLQNKGLKSAIKEIFQNAVDQLLDKSSPCDWIYFEYNQITKEVIVIDNGLGYPFDQIITILTTMHTSKNFEKKPGDYSSGLNGMGASIVNALSTIFIIESYKYDGSAVKVEFKNGYPTTKTPVKIPNKQKKQGTKVYFIPNEEIFGEMNLDWKIIYKMIKLIISFTPIGSSIDFVATDTDNIVHKEKIINKDGIITDLIMKSQHPINRPIICYADNGYCKVETAFCYDTGGTNGPSDVEDITSFANWSPTLGGTHVDGVLDGISRWFTKYMNDIYLANQKNTKNKIKVLPVDTKSGLNVIINAAHLNPEYSAQAKEILSNPDMFEFAKNTVMSGLDEWAKSNPQELTKLCKYFKDIAEIRIKATTEKEKIVNKFQANVLTGYPQKYAKPVKQRKEFFIVEGDSAAGTAKSGRDINTQGIFPIRGKIPNAFRTSRKEFLNNAEVQGICKIILGKDYIRDFDANKDVEWEKIIFMADADVDGAHIASLLLRFFILYMPQLIQAGKVYKAVPPLYSIPKGKGDEYFTANYDFVRYVQKLFLRDNNICYDTKDKKPLSGKDATVLFMKNQDYVYWMDKLSKTYAVEPLLLEMAIFSYYNKQALKSLQKQVKSNYRFMEVSKVKDTVVFEGIINEANTLFMNDRLIRDCKPILDIIEKNQYLYYRMNDRVSSLYEVMKAYEKAQPNRLQRYKGLGEMDADQIAISTMREDGDRTLIRYTIDDVKEEISAIREYESDFSKLFKMVGTVNRQDLLD